MEDLGQGSLLSEDKALMVRNIITGPVSFLSGIRIMVLIALAMIPSLNMSGQLVPVTDQYILNPLTVNPAYAGSRGAINVAAFYRRQWVGISGAPETMTLAVDVPMSDGKIGLGLNISKDKIGVTKETSIGSNYSYTVDIGGGRLSMGLGAGIIATNTAWSDLTVIDPGDDFFLVDSKVFVVPDFSFGLYFTHKNYFASASIPRLLQYKFDFEKNKYSFRIHPDQYGYLLHTGNLFSLEGNAKFLPSVFLSYYPGDKLIADVNAHFGFFERIWVGASYRTTGSMAGLFQFVISNQLKLAYSYYFDFNKLGSYSTGSHEIMLRYQFLYKANVINPLIF